MWQNRLELPYDYGVDVGVGEGVGVADSVAVGVGVGSAVGVGVGSDWPGRRPVVTRISASVALPVMTSTSV